MNRKGSLRGVVAGGVDKSSFGSLISGGRGVGREMPVARRGSGRREPCVAGLVAEKEAA